MNSPKNPQLLSQIDIKKVELELELEAENNKLMARRSFYPDVQFDYFKQILPTNNEIKIPCFPKKIKAITLFDEFDFTEPTYPENHLVPAKDCIGIELTTDFFIKNGFNHDKNQQTERLYAK